MRLHACACTHTMQASFPFWRRIAKQCFTQAPAEDQCTCRTKLVHAELFALAFHNERLPELAQLALGCTPMTKTSESLRCRAEQSVCAASLATNCHATLRWGGGDLDVTQEHRWRSSPHAEAAGQALHATPLSRSCQGRALTSARRPGHSCRSPCLPPCLRSTAPGL